jgi:hypothetical protein
MIVTGEDAMPAIVPAWGFGGMNDRVFIGERKYAKVWATQRFPNLIGHAKRNHGQVHSESFVKYLMLKGHVPITRTKLCFKRVRATGEVWNQDCPGHKLYKPASHNLTEMKY